MRIRLPRPDPLAAKPSMWPTATRLTRSSSFSASGGRCRYRRGRFRGPRTRTRHRSTGGAGHRAQLADGPHRRRRVRGHSRPLCHRRSGVADAAAQKGSLSLSLGTGWAKSLSFTTGRCPVMKYNRQLMMAILHDRIHIAEAVNATAIWLQDAPRGYADSMPEPPRICPGPERLPQQLLRGNGRGSLQAG